ncbi:hypothetical protein [Oceaniglobus ichthyenteri]|uniref:hypothetical protein n=1 Tax=Oceaniglobus ichthyenteri TaxID=2136177 RepID=UPI000D3877F1|nr:hypothetical protein [Oceaniglobus ichthyenteri]
MQIPAQIIGAICVIAAQVYVLLNQLEADVLDDAWSIIDILKWQALGQVAAASIAPDGLRFVALALSSYLAAVLAIVLIPAWVTGVYPVMTFIALFNGHPSLAISFVGLTLYVAASYYAVRLLYAHEL